VQVPEFPVSGLLKDHLHLLWLYRFGKGAKALPLVTVLDLLTLKGGACHLSTLRNNLQAYAYK
jgi:hypothetical protein